MRTKKIVFIVTITMINCHADVAWNNSTITSNVTDTNITINGTNTLANNINVTANSTDVTITVAGAASLSDNSNGYTLSLITTSTLRSININFGSATLTIGGSLIFNIQKSTTLSFAGGSLIVQNNATLLADPMA